MASQAFTSLSKVGLSVAVTGFITTECIYTVDGGEMAVILDRVRGILPEAKGEGTHFKIPFFQYPQIMNIRARPRLISSVTGTKDLQKVDISLRVLYRPQESHLSLIYRTLGMDYDDRVLPSVGNEVLKAVVAQYNADQLLTSREKVSQQISTELRERAKGFNIILDDVAITHLAYGPEFTHAVEAKQVAFQDAERSKFVVMKAEQERIAAIIRAEGEAEAARLISESVKNCGGGFIEVQRIDAAKDIAESLAKSRNVTYLPKNGGGGGGGILLGLNNQA